MGEKWRIPSVFVKFVTNTKSVVIGTCIQSGAMGGRNVALLYRNFDILNGDGSLEGYANSSSI